MPAITPEQAHELFVQYFNAGDLDGILALYEPSATLVKYPGPAVQGLESIREAMVEFLSINGHMKLKVDRVLSTADVALLFSSWTLRGTSADGTPVVSSGQTSDVVRRQADGSWLFVIDNPHGCAAAK
jgi:Ketosteroid isomerase homolog